MFKTLLALVICTSLSIDIFAQERKVNSLEEETKTEVQHGKFVYNYYGFFVRGGRFDHGFGSVYKPYSCINSFNVKEYLYKKYNIEEVYHGCFVNEDEVSKHISNDSVTALINKAFYSDTSWTIDREIGFIDSCQAHFSNKLSAYLFLSESELMDVVYYKYIRQGARLCKAVRYDWEKKEFNFEILLDGNPMELQGLKPTWIVKGQYSIDKGKLVNLKSKALDRVGSFSTNVFYWPNSVDQLLLFPAHH